MEQSNPDLVPLISNYRRWSYFMAIQYKRYFPSDWDDIAQEAMIGMWLSLRSYDRTKGALPSWFTRAAKQRIQRQLKTKHWFGMPPRYGHHKVKAEEIPVVFKDEDGTWLPSIVDSPDLLAYHRNAIVKVINDLTPDQREYVYRRFWLDQGHGEIVTLMGKNSWVGAKTKLRQSLAHLKGE